MKLWKIALPVLGAIAAIFFYRGCGKMDYANFPPRATGGWVAFGDSLTAGYGASQGNDYPSALSQKIGRPILNKGVSGATTESALSHVDEILRLQPRVVLLCLGGNDGLQQLPINTTFGNLSTIIDRFQESGSFVVLIGVRGASLSDRYSTPFKTLAKEKRVLFVQNILSGVLGSPSLMSDYIHPNDEGYEAIARRLEEILSPFLPQL